MSCSAHVNHVRPHAYLLQLKAEALLKSTSLSECEASLQRDAAARAQIESEVAALRMDRERDLRDLRTMHSAELTSAREEGIRRAEDAAAARAAEVRKNCEGSTSCNEPSSERHVCTWTITLN